MPKWERGKINTSPVISSETKIRVRYADTDQMKIVYYGKYFEYFEQGRSDFLRQIGLPYGEMEQRGFLLPVVEAHAEYKKSAIFDDELTVRTTVSDIPLARIRISYEVFRGENELLVEGYTVHSFLNAVKRSPTRAPEFLTSILERLLKKAAQ